MFGIVSPPVCSCKERWGPMSCGSPLRISTCIILLDDFFKIHTAATLRQVHSGTTTELAGVNANCGTKMTKRDIIQRTIYTLHATQGRAASGSRVDFLASWNVRDRFSAMKICSEYIADGLHSLSPSLFFRKHVHCLSSLIFSGHIAFKRGTETNSSFHADRKIRISERLLSKIWLIFLVLTQSFIAWSWTCKANK